MAAPDLNSIFRSQRVKSRMAGCLLGINLGGFACELRRMGYSVHTVHAYTQAAEHFCNWLVFSGVPLNEIRDEHAEKFLHQHLSICRCSVPAPQTLHSVRPAIRHLLGFLRERQVIECEQVAAPGVLDFYIEDFDSYLAEICGLSNATRIYRRRYVRYFLEWKFHRRTVEVAKISPGDIRRFLIGYLTHCSPGSGRVIAGSLKSYFRFLHLKGMGNLGLVLGVPSIQLRPSQCIPRFLTSSELAAFLNSFNRKTAVGRRDYAMALCMVELGLRASEVADLTLDDLRWREGHMVVSDHKSRRQRMLPLSNRLGNVLADYVSHSRFSGVTRNLFVRHRVPHGAQLATHHVRGAMRRAYARAGLSEMLTGTHLLRRTAATRMLQGGATMKEIADVLGHRSLDTTKAYARVNLRQLQSVALPWPESNR